MKKGTLKFFFLESRDCWTFCKKQLPGSPKALTCSAPTCSADGKG